MLKKTALTLLLSGVLAGNAAALGLGEITLDSALNEPFSAEIMVENPDGLTPDNLIVSIATQENYELSGVTRPFFHTQIDFEVVEYGDGLKVIVTSENSIVEPFVDFIVEARWPQGKLLRQYTVLLDLPTFSGATVSTVPLVKSQGGQTAPTRAPDPQPSVRVVEPSVTTPVSVPSPAAEPAAETSRPQPVVNSSQPASAPSGGYMVQNGDTLWGIGAALARREGLQPQQAMVAIHAANPSAFINGDINMLRRGAVLRMPERNSMETIPFDSAVAEIEDRLNQSPANQSQVAQPSQTGFGPSSDSIDQPGSQQGSVADIVNESDRYSSTSSSPAVQGRLELARVDDPNSLDDQSGMVTSGGESLLSGAAADGLGSDVLGDELAILQEQLDISRLENREIKEQMANLEGQLEEFKRALELQNEELRASQLVAAQTNQNPAQSSAVGQSGGGFMELLKENLIWIALVVVAVLIAVVLFLRGRKQDDDAEVLQQETGFRNYEKQNAVAPESSKPDTPAIVEVDEPVENIIDPVKPEKGPAAEPLRASSADLEDTENLDALLFAGGTAAAAQSDEESKGEDSSEMEESESVEFELDEPLIVEDDLEDFKEEETDENAVEFESDDSLQQEENLEGMADYSDELKVYQDAMGVGKEEEPAEPEEIPEISVDEEYDGMPGLEIEPEQERSAPDPVEACATKLELAEAYRDMGDMDGAIKLLKEVAVDGNDSQQEQARALLVELS